MNYWHIDEDTVVLSENLISEIADAIEAHLDNIDIDDIDVDTERSSYEGESDIEVPGHPELYITADWEAEYWYRVWTETWYDPYCTPTFSEGEVERVWCGTVCIDHEEFVIANAEELQQRIADIVYCREMAAYDRAVETRKAREEARKAKHQAVWKTQTNS